MRSKRVHNPLIDLLRENFLSAGATNRDATKGSGSRTACLTMVYKLMQSASKRWRLLNGSEFIPDVIRGVPFIDGQKTPEVAARKISRT